MEVPSWDSWLTPTEPPTLPQSSSLCFQVTQGWLSPGPKLRRAHPLGSHGRELGQLTLAWRSQWSQIHRLLFSYHDCFLRWTAHEWKWAWKEPQLPHPNLAGQQRGRTPLGSYLLHKRKSLSHQARHAAGASTRPRHRADRASEGHPAGTLLNRR